MRSSYHLTSPDGRKWEFSPDAVDLSEFEAYGTGQIHDDGFETVAEMPVDGGTSPAFGRGTETNAEEAEAFFWLDARVETDSDSDGRGDTFKGDYRIVVVNEAGNRVEGGTIHQGQLRRSRKGDPDTDDYGNWGIAFPRQYLMDNQAEIPPNKGYSVAIQLKARNGTKTFDLADSKGLMEGYSGQPLN